MTPDPAATAALRDHRYPDGTFAGLIDTPFVTAPTRAALKARLVKPAVTAPALAGQGFLDLAAADRDRVISAVQDGDPPGEAWRALPAKRFFEDLLAAVTEAFYAHPLSQEEIGYAGYADARGWQAIGLGERELREPEPLGVSGGGLR